MIQQHHFHFAYCSAVYNKYRTTNLCIRNTWHVGLKKKKEQKKKAQLKENPLAPGLTQSKRWHSAMDQLKAFPEIL